VAIDGVTKALDVDVVSLRLRETQMERTNQVLPLTDRRFTSVAHAVHQVNYVLHQNTSVMKIAAQAV
jgi:hypothetical protein